MKVFEFKWIDEIEAMRPNYCYIEFGPYQIYKITYDGKMLVTRKLTTYQCNKLLDKI